MKPRIDRTNLQNLVMKVGHTKLIDVNISGEPVPTVTWSFKNAVRYLIRIQFYVNCIINTKYIISYIEKYFYFFHKIN